MLGNLFNPRKSGQSIGDVSQISSTTTSLNGAPAVEKTQEQNVVSSQMAPVRRQDMSVMTHLDGRTTTILEHAKDETVRIRQEYIEPEQILFGVLFDEEIFKVLQEFSVDVAKVSREIQSKETEGSFSGQPSLSESSKQIFEQAFSGAKNRGSDFVTPEDILVAIFSHSVSNALKAQGVTKEQLEEKLEKSSAGGGGYGKKSIIEKYGVDLTKQAKDGTLDPIAGRDAEIERLVHILLRRTKNNPIIIGEAGVGKTAIVEGVAQQIASGKIPKDLANRRIIQLDLASLVAGASHRGEFEERLRNVIKEAMAAEGKIILFIDEIHALIGTGDTQGALDASNIIKPFLARGQLQIIGTTTTVEYRKYFEKDKAFARRFQPIIAAEPSEEVALQMLEVLKAKYEKFHNVVLTPDAMKAAVYLSKKYIGERYLPDKAVDLLDEAAAQVKLEVGSGKRQDNNVVKSDIERVVSGWTGIPVTKLTEDESQKLLNLDKLIHQRLIDQEEAVLAVSEAVRRGRIGLAAANRPIASFIFLGPTGVGKTELAKTLAEILFGREDATIRLDMSEYMEKHEVAKLIGAPPGYVGYEEGGQLTEAVRAKPYSIVLLDEVEKAHPDVFNILLQLLEDGRLTDNKGNTISFKNTIIIATSNIGSALIQQQLSSQQQPGKQVDEAKAFAQLTGVLMQELHKFFKPELLNRFDELVVFKPLRKQDMAAIAKLGIDKTAKLLKEQGFGVSISDQALKQLAEEGYDPIYGARPLRRLIQTAIENPIALHIISKEFVTGDTIAIDFNVSHGDFVFNKAAGAAATATAQPPVQDGQSSLPAQPQSVAPQPTPSLQSSSQPVENTGQAPQAAAPPAPFVQ